MPDLDFRIAGAKAIPYAASPCLALALQIANQPVAEEISSISLQCQIRIVPPAREYSPEEKAGLVELFGEPARWGRSMPPSFLWTHAQLVVPAFEGSIAVDLPVPCTYDFSIGGTKYFHAVKEGDVSLLLLFSGTVFFRTEEGSIQISRVPWSKEAVFRLPVQVWQEMMEHYHPNSAVLRLRRDVFDRLYRLKIERGLSTFDQVLESLLPEPG